MDTTKTHDKFFDSYFLLSWCLTIFAIAPLFYPGYFQTHSGFIPLWSIHNLKDNLTEFTWLPLHIEFQMWRSDGLLPYYLASLLPMSPLNAMKTILAIGILAGNSGMYLWTKSWFGQKGAVVSAMVYTYSPFILATIYVRGAYSELFFWGLLPWAIFYTIPLVAPFPSPSGRGARWEGKVAHSGIGDGTAKILIAMLTWLSLGLCNLGLSVVALMILLLIQLSFHRPQALRLISSAVVGLSGAILITTFVVPEFLPSLTNHSDHLLYPAQFFSAFWGHGISRVGWNDGMSFSYGLPAIGLTIFAMYLWGGRHVKASFDPPGLPLIFLSIAVIITMLLMPLSSWLWQIFPFDYILTYPWQLLGFSTLALAVMSGMCLRLDERLSQLPMFGSILIIIVLAMYPNLEPKFIQAPLPEKPTAIYHNAEAPKTPALLLLLDYEFLVDNPTLNEIELAPYDEPQELFIPYEPIVSGSAKSFSHDIIYLRVHWQPVELLEKSYTVFAHLVSEDGQLITQVDTVPQAYKYPTTDWIPGEIVEDMYRFRLPKSSAKPHQVWLRLHDSEALIRLAVFGDNEGRAKLGLSE